MGLKKKTWESLAFGLFVIYLLFLIYFLFFAGEFGRENFKPERASNLTLFREIRRAISSTDVLGLPYFLINVVGNIMAFFPMGFLVPIFADNLRKFWKTTLFCFGFSALAECLQFVTKTGCMDVDDLLLNTLGGIMGYFIYYCFFRRKRK